MSDEEKPDGTKIKFHPGMSKDSALMLLQYAMLARSPAAQRPMKWPILGVGGPCASAKHAEGDVSKDRPEAKE